MRSVVVPVVVTQMELNMTLNVLNSVGSGRLCYFICLGRFPVCWMTNAADINLVLIQKRVYYYLKSWCRTNHFFAIYVCATRLKQIVSPYVVVLLDGCPWSINRFAHAFQGLVKNLKNETYSNISKKVYLLILFTLDSLEAHEESRLIINHLI